MIIIIRFFSEKNNKNKNNLFGKSGKNYEEDNNNYFLGKKALFSNINDKSDKNECLILNMKKMMKKMMKIQN